jgi:hypothetical protein
MRVYFVVGRLGGHVDGGGIRENDVGRGGIHP